LGEKARHVWNEAHFAGAAPKIARAGIGARCSRKDHPGCSVASLGKFSAKSVGYTAIAEITKKTDISIAIESLARSKHRRVTSVTFSIKAQAVQNGDE
jgi:hypothetical protein